MKIEIEINEKKIEIFYEKDGRFSYAKFKDGENITCQLVFEGKTYNITEHRSVLFGNTEVCDARYIQLIELESYIPYHLFIPNK